MNHISLIRHVALDMDGTIYKGDSLFPFTLPFLHLLKQLGIGYTFLTNNSSKSVAAYVKHLATMGITADADQLFTSADSTIVYLREHFPNAQRLFVLGTDSLASHFIDSGYQVLPDDVLPDLVIIGFDLDLPYGRLCKACWWINQGIPHVATHPDRVCPTDLPTTLVDCGAICACIESATGRAPVAVLGKPDERMLRGILQRHNLQPNQLAMVGDRIYTDVAMAQRSGAFGVLVLTGEATAQDAEEAQPPPDLVLPSLAEFGGLLAQQPCITPESESYNQERLV
jgi:HAD superfamily hydrolase (TIGR01450 family)